MQFKNMDDVYDYIEDHSVNIVEELPSCDFCYDLIDSHDGTIQYCIIKEPNGGNELIFCCEEHMNNYFEQLIEKGE